MVKPLHDYYLIKLIITESKKGIVILADNEDNKPLRKAEIVAVPKDNEIELTPGQIVYVQQHYAQPLLEDTMIIKAQYIVTSID